MSPTAMTFNKIPPAAIIVVLAVVGVGYYVVHNRTFKPVASSQIASFEDCANAGYPILQTYPEQCKAPDGKIFTKQNTLPLQSGIAGVVLLGPMCPVERIPPDPKCADKPFQTDLVATKADGVTVMQNFSSDANGKFNVALPPGEYAVHNSVNTKPYPRCTNSNPIRVVANTFTEVTVNCDTGIR